LIDRVDKWNPRMCDHIVLSVDGCKICHDLRVLCQIKWAKYDKCFNGLILYERDIIQLFLFLDQTEGAFEFLYEKVWKGFLLLMPRAMITTGVIAIAFKMNGFLWPYGLTQVASIPSDFIQIYLYKGTREFGSKALDIQVARDKRRERNRKYRARRKERRYKIRQKNSDGDGNS